VSATRMVARRFTMASDANANWNTTSRSITPTNVRRNLHERGAQIERDRRYRAAVRQHRLAAFRPHQNFWVATLHIPLRLPSLG
jgi:hypothetical protein